MAKDLFHDAVKIALQKEGWEITHDPLMLESLETQIFVDLGAEQVIGAQRDKELIAVEPGRRSDKELPGYLIRL